MKKIVIASGNAGKLREIARILEPLAIVAAVKGHVTVTASRGGHATRATFGQALERGARALIVTRDDVSVREAIETARRSEVALVLVADASSAIEALGAWHRMRLACPVIGITGSTGKTTTKDFLRSVLATRMRVVATSGNRNNELGVPLTVMEAATDRSEAVAVGKVIESMVGGFGFSSIDFGGSDVGSNEKDRAFSDFAVSRMM